MPWYALMDGDDGGTWGIGGMTTCEVGMGIIMPLLRITMMLNISSNLSSRSSSLLPCSTSLSALLSSSCVSVAFISSCCFANLSIMVEMSFWALSDFVILRLFCQDDPGWSSSFACWHSWLVSLRWFCSVCDCWATSSAVDSCWLCSSVHGCWFSSCCVSSSSSCW